MRSKVKKKTNYKAHNTKAVSDKCIKQRVLHAENIMAAGALRHREIFQFQFCSFFTVTEIWNLTNTSLNSNTNSSISSLQSLTSFSSNLQQLSQGTHPRLRLNFDPEILHRPLRTAVKQMQCYPNKDRIFS